MQRRTYGLFKLTVSVLAGSWALGCGGPAPEESQPATGEQLASRKDASYIHNGNAWSMSNGVASIPVCWDSTGFDTEKGWVRSIVEARFEGQPFFHVDFTGWGQCGVFSSGIRIQLSDTTSDNNPRVKALGRGLNGMANGMVLNFTFNNWGYGSCNTAVVGDSGRRYCIEAIGVHEFGHALSLAHEQNRGDKPSSCTDSPQGTNGDMYVGNFDQGSLMAYCNPTWNNGGNLSQGDVAGLARLYGGGGDVFVGSSTGSGFSSGQARHDGFCIGNEVCLTGDFNGDGRQDLVTFTRGTTHDVYVALSTGTGFNGSGWKWHDDFAYDGETPRVGDVNGDGKDDIVVFTHSPANDVYVALSTGSSFGGAGLWHGDFAYTGELPEVGDFNGDGRDDIVTFTQGSSNDVYVALSTGSSFGGAGLWHGDFAYSGETPKVGDFNGDGRDDIVTFTHGSASDVYVALSTGSSFGGAGLWHSDFAYSGEIPAVGDVNGDGRDDIVTFVRGSQGTVYAATSSGGSFNGYSWLWSTGLCLAQDVCAVADVTGDGRADAIGFKRN
jgi:hypothetical protein